MLSLIASVTGSVLLTNGIFNKLTSKYLANNLAKNITTDIILKDSNYILKKTIKKSELRQVMIGQYVQEWAPPIYINSNIIGIPIGGGTFTNNERVGIINYIDHNELCFAPMTTIIPKKTNPLIEQLNLSKLKKILKEKYNTDFNTIVKSDLLLLKEYDFEGTMYFYGNKKNKFEFIYASDDADHLIEIITHKTYLPQIIIGCIIICIYILYYKN